MGDTDPDVHHVISKNSNFTIVSLWSTIDIKEQPALAPPKIGKTCTHKVLYPVIVSVKQIGQPRKLYFFITQRNLEVSKVEIYSKC